jgi:4-hydroxy-tetrahydrodipicolinate reductase
MNVALIGYGKMGKAIEEIALQRGHQIVLKIDEHNTGDFSRENFSKADVAIEFTGPDSAYENVKKAIDFQKPVVSGSTGWTNRLAEMEAYCKQQNGSLIYASNFSIGVNIFFELNKKLASLMAPHPDYKVEVEETHHTTKKDAPSGTAITLAEQIMTHLTYKKKWVNGQSRNESELPIVSKRIDPAAGTHNVRYTSTIDDIEIVHTAHNRVGFAAGAVLAAEFLKNKKGIFTMKDVLNF